MVPWLSSDPVLNIAFFYHGDFALCLHMTERLPKENLDNCWCGTKSLWLLSLHEEKKLN